MSRQDEVTVFDTNEATLDEDIPTMKFMKQYPGHLNVGTIDDPLPLAGFGWGIMGGVIFIVCLYASYQMIFHG